MGDGLHTSRNSETIPGMNHLNPQYLETNRIVFYKKGLFLKNQHYICEMSYNRKNYHISLHSVGNFNDMSHVTDSRTLVLPICTQTISLIEQHSNNLDALADRLRMDAKNRKISILGFKMVPVEQGMGQQGFKNLPILERKKSQRIISPGGKSARRQRTDTSVDSALVFSDANEKARSLYEE